MGRKEQIIEALGLYPIWVSKNRTNANSICADINEIGNKSRPRVDLENDHKLHIRLITASIFFALGVTTIFVLLGMGATATGQIFRTAERLTVE